MKKSKPPPCPYTYLTSGSPHPERPPLHGLPLSAAQGEFQGLLRGLALATRGLPRSTPPPRLQAGGPELPTPQPQRRRSGQSLDRKVISHYQQFYEEKTKLAREDTFLFFSAPWLTAFERTFLWIDDFKPTLVFRFLGSLVDDLTAAQSEEIERIGAKTRRRERDLAAAMARVQESVAAQPLLCLLRASAGQPERKGEICNLEAALAELGESMVAVLEEANALRTTTAWRVMEVLSPAQTMKLLAAAVQFQVRVRRWGKQRAASASLQ